MISRALFVQVRHLATLLAALFAAQSARAIDTSGLLDVRAVSAHAQDSWTRAGLGKLRYDGQNDGLRLGQAMLRIDAELLDTVSGVLIFNAADDRRGVLDINEGWLRWNP